MQCELLRTEGLEYRQAGFKQLAGAGLRLMESETLGVVGRRGSGITSLTRILAGELPPSAGTIFLHNRPADAEQLARQVALIRRESRLVPSLTLSENLFVPPPAGSPARLFSARRLAARCKAHLDELGLALTPASPVDKLTPAQHHLLLMTKLALTGRGVLVLYNIAAEYTAAERETLLAHLHRMNRAGMSLVYAVHRWDSVLAGLDRVTILRDGRCVKTFWDGSQSREVVHNFIYGYVGDSGSQPLDTPVPPGAAPLFTLAGLPLYKGGFTGIFDSDGTSGQLERTLLEQAREQKRPVAVIRSNSIHADWVAGLSVLDNLLLPISKRVSNPLGRISAKVQQVLAQECCEVLGLSRDSLALPVAALPRRDLIRLLFYRWKQRHPAVYLLQNPALELDIAEREVLQQELRGVLETGKPVLYLSTSLQDVHRLARQPLQLSEGSLKGGMAL